MASVPTSCRYCTRHSPVLLAPESVGRQHSILTLTFLRTPAELNIIRQTMIINCSLWCNFGARCSPQGGASVLISRCFPQLMLLCRRMRPAQMQATSWEASEGQRPPSVSGRPGDARCTSAPHSWPSTPHDTHCLYLANLHTLHQQTLQLQECHLAFILLQTPCG